MKHYQILKRGKCMTSLDLMVHKVSEEMEDLLAVKEDITHIQVALMALVILVILVIFFLHFLQEDLEVDSLEEDHLDQEKVRT